MSGYRYCKVFVNGVVSSALMELLAAKFGSRFERHSMPVSGLVIEVRSNSDAMSSADPGDDFVRWPVTVEVDAEDETGERGIVNAVATILRASWDAGHPAVAACDFEDELPWSGGIQRLGHR